MKATSIKGAKHPAWALKYKRKGTELRLIYGKYYLYEISSKWNPEKKRAQKITGKLLGKITEKEGFVISEKNKLRAELQELKSNPVFQKEYGASYFFLHQFKDYVAKLKEYFPSLWKEIIVLSFVRLVYQAPIKNIGFKYENSYLSEYYPELNFTAKNISSLLKVIGAERERAVKFMQSFIQKGEYLLIDGTHILSDSKNLEIAKPGYNSEHTYAPQFNLLFLFSYKLKLPVFYRVLPGNIREIQAFKLTLEESGLEDSIIISDKGFYSKDNIKELEAEKLKYIIPLKRNSHLINYENIEAPLKNGFEGYFHYNQKYIWYYSLEKSNNQKAIVYYDEELKIKEEKDYLDRIENHLKNYKLEVFKVEQARFGTITLFTNLNESPEEVYKYYKFRNNIETMFDAMKNILHADSSYMHNELTLRGWMLINHIALQWYYQIYKLLIEKKLNKKYSVGDIIMHLLEIKKVNIKDEWRTSEINTKTKDLLKKLGINIT